MDLRVLFATIHRHEWRILRYIVAGGISATTNLSILFVLTSVLDVWYLYSSMVAISVATVVSFVLQKTWTFQNFEVDRVRVQFPKHVMLVLCNIALNTLALYILVEKFSLWYLFAQIISGGMLASLNYLVYKYIIFAAVVE